MAPTPDAHLGELVSANPAAARVLRRHHLDYVGHGQERLQVACKAAGIQPQQIIAEIAAEPPTATDVVWLQRPLDQLIDHIISHYHVPQRLDLAENAHLARRLALAKDDPVLTEVSTICERLHREGISHLDREEKVVFPWIRSTRPTGPDSPVWELREEHDHHQELLLRLRRITADYTAAAGVGEDQRRLYVRLAETEGELLDHMHLENNVLFPRALAESVPSGERL